MLDLKTTAGDGLVELSLEEGLFPRDAIFAAAFAFIDRCWVHLDVDRAAGGRLSLRLRVKNPATTDVAAIGDELTGELLGQAWRLGVLDQGRGIVEAVAAKAFGAPAATARDAGSLDDLLGEDGAFEDPLGIATSWEEKYGHKAEGAGGQGS